MWGSSVIQRDIRGATLTPGQLPNRKVSLIGNKATPPQALVKVPMVKSVLIRCCTYLTHCFSAFLCSGLWALLCRPHKQCRDFGYHEACCTDEGCLLQQGERQVLHHIAHPLKLMAFYPCGVKGPTTRVVLLELPGLTTAEFIEYPLKYSKYHFRRLKFNQDG